MVTRCYSEVGIAIRPVRDITLFSLYRYAFQGTASAADSGDRHERPSLPVHGPGSASTGSVATNRWTTTACWPAFARVDAVVKARDGSTQIVPAFYPATCPATQWKTRPCSISRCCKPATAIGRASSPRRRSSMQPETRNRQCAPPAPKCVMTGSWTDTAYRGSQVTRR